MEIRRMPLKLIVALALAAGILTGCGEDEEPASGGGEQAAPSTKTPAVLEEAGEWAICADMTYPPMTFMEGNEPTGVDIDLANRLAEMMGTEAKFNQTGFPGIIAALNAGKCDSIFNGMNVTEEREKEISFVVYAKATQSFMVVKGEEGGYASIEDFAGKDVGVQIGSANIEFLEQHNESAAEKINVKPFPKDVDAVAALKTGKLDAYFADTAVVAFYERENPEEFAATDVAVNPVPYGIGIRKDETELQEALQKGVDELYANGEAQKILEKWNLGEKGARPEG
jgi:polar amino acid transport system substrate-binding protein